MMCDAQVGLFINFFRLDFVLSKVSDLSFNFNKLCYAAVILTVSLFFVAFPHLKSFKKTKPENAIFALSKHV